jgi:hypothetical protein
MSALVITSASCLAQSFLHDQLIRFQVPTASDDFPLARFGQAAALYLAPADEATLGASVEAFASDVQRVTGIKPRILHSFDPPVPWRDRHLSR